MAWEDMRLVKATAYAEVGFARFKGDAEKQAAAYLTNPYREKWVEQVIVVARGKGRGFAVFAVAYSPTA